MYTEEQAKRAIAEKNLKDLVKKIALSSHKEALEIAKRTLLPYRFIYNYCTLSGKKAKEYQDISLNPYYPLSELPAFAKWDYSTFDYSKEQWLKGSSFEDGTKDENGKALFSIAPYPKELEKRIMELEKPFRYYLDKEKREMFYTRFLFYCENDIGRYSPFDIFGEMGKTVEEAEERKKYYRALLEDAKRTPDKYFLKEHPFKAGYEKKIDTEEELKNFLHGLCES